MAVVLASTSPSVKIQQFSHDLVRGDDDYEVVPFFAATCLSIFSLRRAITFQ